MNETEANIAIKILHDEEAIARAMEPRKDEDIIDAQAEEGGEVEIILGGVIYKLRPRKGRYHTKQFKRVIEPILSKIESVSDVLKELFISGQVDFKTIDEDSMSSIISLIRRFVTTEFDEVLDVVYMWSDEIAADREVLEGSEDKEGTVTEVELISAVLIIGKFVYGPLSTALKQIGRQMGVQMK